MLVVFSTVSDITASQSAKIADFTHNLLPFNLRAREGFCMHNLTPLKSTE